MAKKPDEVSVQSFALGMNTRRPDFRLRTEEGFFQRETVNGDITADGTVRRRTGYEQELAGDAAHSLWSYGAEAFYADGPSLYRLGDVADELDVALVYGALRVGAPVSYAAAPQGGTFWTDGLALKHCVGAIVDDLAPERPALEPTVSIAAGYLPAGVYRYCFSYTDSAGRESPATHLQQIELDAAGGISFVMGGAVPAGLTLNAFVSPPNGAETYLVAEIESGSTVYEFQAEGRRCHTVGLERMPAGRFVRYANGRLLVALGSTLFYSRPFMPGLYDPVRDFIPLPAEITVLEPVDGGASGVYVVADQTYWLSADLPGTALQTVLPYGAVAGSAVPRPDLTAVHWMSERGLVLASGGAEIKNLQEQNVAVAPTTRGASLVREVNGEQCAVSAMVGGAGPQRAVVSSYMEAEIVSGG
ncbi:MAG: hypothetical protein AAB131_18085 [Actinomycetota bacterium]